MLIIYQSGRSRLLDVHAKEIFFQWQRLFIAAWNGSSGSQRPNCRNNDRFDALILEKELSHWKYVDNLPIQPKTSTRYPRQWIFFQRQRLYIATWSGSSGSLYGQIAVIMTVFDAFVLQKELSQQKYVDKSPIQPKSPTRYPRRKKFFTTTTAFYGRMKWFVLLPTAKLP